MPAQGKPRCLEKHSVTGRLASSSWPQLKSQEPPQVPSPCAPSVLISAWRQLPQAVLPTDFEEGTRGFKLSKLSRCNSHFYLGKKWIKNSRLLISSVDLSLPSDSFQRPGWSVSQAGYFHIRSQVLNGSLLITAPLREPHGGHGLQRGKFLC